MYVTLHPNWSLHILFLLPRMFSPLLYLVVSHDFFFFKIFSCLLPPVGLLLGQISLLCAPLVPCAYPKWRNLSLLFSPVNKKCLKVKNGALFVWGPQHWVLARDRGKWSVSEWVSWWSEVWVLHLSAISCAVSHFFLGINISTCTQTWPRSYVGTLYIYFSFSVVVRFSYIHGGCYQLSCWVI